MPETLTVQVPDIGDFDDVGVIEILVSPGDRVAVEDPLVTLESDKATMDVPSPRAGIVREVLVALDDSVRQGSAIITLELTDEATAPPPQPTGGSTAQAAAGPTPQAPPQAGAKGAGAQQRAATGDQSRAEGPQARRARSEAQPSEVERCDVLVLGSGPGGYTAAFRAADLGKRVVLVERHATLGGVCLNVGCIPSKTLLHMAAVVAEAAELSHHGVEFGAPRFDYARIRAHKDAVVKTLTDGLARLSKQRKVEVVTGTGRFTGPHAVAVESADGLRTISFDHAIVAVGSRSARLPGLPDDPRILDSTSALEIDGEARRLLVVGGGIIGLEMASVYDALGSEVTVVEMLPNLVPGADPDLVRPLQRRIAKRYAGIHLETKVSGVSARDDGLHVSFEGAKAPSDAVFDRVLVAVGRVPNGDRIDAGAGGIAVDERGFIAVDDRMRTNVPHIHAIGDVTGAPLLAHKATHQGAVAAEVIAGLPAAFDARTIPSVAYTDPEIAWTGLTETEAKSRGIEVDKGTFPWAASGRALGIARSEGLTKLLFSRENGRLVGAGMVGPHAGELVAEATLALELGADAEDLALTIHPHPTLSETVGLAAEVAAGTVTDLYAPPRRRGK